MRRAHPSKLAAGLRRLSAASLEKAERRSVRRYPFIAAVEITELGSGDQRSGRTSDLSLGGCYVDILDPFPRGTLVHLRIFSLEDVFETRGRWSLPTPASGWALASAG